MKITDFIKNYNAKRFMNTKQGVDERIEYIKKELEIKEYIPLNQKRSIAKTVLESCAHISDGVITIDSIQKYLLFTMAMLSAYTNLDPDDDVSISDTYDMFCSIQIDNGTLLDAIIKTFETEYTRCNDVLNMMTADLLAENNIEKQVGKFLTSISTKIDKLVDKLGDMNMDLSQLDIDKITNMIDMIK